MNIYPAIDLRQGRCVRLSQGDFSRSTVYEGTPIEVAQAYARAGAAHLHVVDLDGAVAGEPRHVDWLLRLAGESGLSIQTGGGIRSIAHGEALIKAGVARVIIGSLAVKDPALFAGLARALGSEHITLAVDVRIENGSPRVAVSGWQAGSDVTIWELLQEVAPLGIRHVLCTDISRDGMMNGPNFELYQSILERHPGLELQASGGIGKLDDVRRLKSLGLPGAIIGRALYEGSFRLEEALQC